MKTINEKGIQMSKVMLVFAAVIMTLLLPLVLAAAPKSNAVKVQIDNFSFTPQTLTIHPGTQVTWINKDDVPHTVSSVDKKFASKALDTDEQFSFVFTAPGTYKYYCAIHPHMTGIIVVQ